MSRLPFVFYLREDVFLIAQELLGKVLCTQLDGEELTSGRIVEVEAYWAPLDKASHAYAGRRTPRNEVMYATGGVAYVYQCYGIHYLVNVVTNQIDIAHAILIRAIEPLTGIQRMLQRRQKCRVDTTLTSGPGTVTQALGLTKQHNGLSFQGPKLWIEDREDVFLTKDDIVHAPRVGIEYAAEYAEKPWRYYIKGNKWVSRVKRGGL